MINKLKYISFITLLFAFSAQKVFSQIDTISLSSFKLIGQVKRIIEVTYSAKDSIGFIVKDEYLGENWNFKFDNKQYRTNFIYEFDQKGRNTSHVILPQEKSSHTVTNFNYKNRLLIESTETMFFSDATIPIKNLYKYDLKENLIGIYIYRYNELLRKKIFKYDTNKNPIEKFEIDKEGNITERANYFYKDNKISFEKNFGEISNDEKKFEYDSYGNIVFESIKFGKSKYNDNEMFFENKFTYDNNRVTNKNQFRDGIETWKEEFDYLDERLYRETKLFEQDSSTLVCKTYKYNADNSAIIEINEKDKKIIEEYDEYNNAVRLFYSFKDGKIEEYIYKYTFDTNANWTEIIEFKNTVPLKIRIRKIEYYNTGK